MREGDTVSRQGGDEFVVLLPDANASRAASVAQEILRRLGFVCRIGEHDISVSVSIGIAMAPDDGTDFATLSKCAEIAMYRAKQEGRNTLRFFFPEMQERTLRHVQLTGALRGAVERGEMQLHYQPQVDLQTGELSGVEALLRWTHPLFGAVSPGEFIPLAEESGLIIPIGDWVLREAANQLTQWRSTLDADFRLSVNVSPIQLHSGSHQVAPWLEHLRSLQLPGEALTIEITERVLLEPDPLSDGKLNALQEAGMQLALDDFGTGYSSLSYLKRFDIDYIKIDRSFVSHLSRDSQDLVLCQAIIAMAHQLGIHVVAEGVETQEQHDILLAAGCDYGQGYWYCRPIAAAALSERLRQQQEGTLALPTP